MATQGGRASTPVTQNDLTDRSQAAQGGRASTPVTQRDLTDRSQASQGGSASTPVTQSDLTARSQPEPRTPQDPAPAWSGLAAHLFDEPYEFNFFQAVRLLHKLLPERTPIGKGGPPGREPVRFRAWVSLNFPPSQIYDLTVPTPDQPIPVMTQAFMGLFGPSGILPRHYTELMIRLQRDSKGPEKFLLRDWLDLFNHRLVSLFYRAWEKYRFVLPYERREFERADPDVFSRSLLSLTGLGIPPLRNRLTITTGSVHEPAGHDSVLASVDDQSILYYGGFFAHRPRNALSLQALVGHYFQTPVEVIQFQGQWLALEPQVQTRLGALDGNCELGASSVVGDKIWNVQNKIRIRLGPLGYERFLDFLPDPTPTPSRKDFFLLLHLVRLYVGPELDFDVQLVLKAEDVPEAQLSSEGTIGARLGWNTWIRTAPFQTDADDGVFPDTEVFHLGEDHSGLGL
jgi:type VI secretion system protein ImpH